MKKKRIILSIVSVLVMATITIFFNASRISDSPEPYKYFGDGASSVVSAGETIYKNDKFRCPNGESAEDFYEEELKERLRECSLGDSNSGKKRKLSHVEVNAVASFLKTL